MKTCKKLMAVFLTIATLIGIFSCATTVFAEEYNEYADNKAYQESLLTEAVETEGEQSEIVCEVPEKRDEFSKTYKRADGSFTSVVSKTPIHKLENGEWEEINNTLETNDDAINNIDGAFDVEFPETISENEQITVSNNGESIAFSVNGIENATGIVEEKETTEADIIKQDLQKAVSQITYENVDENTDIQYVVSSNYIKENIVVSNKESLKDSYSFDIEKGNLSAELDNKNNLIFKNDKNEVAFTIPAPVMTDADNAFSYDIDVSVKNADKSVITLTYTPSKEWLESADREYPIIIDPVIIFDDGNEILYEDTSIINIAEEPESRTTNYSNEAVGYIGSGDSVQGNVLVKLNMDAFSYFKKPNLEVLDFIFYGSGYVKGGNALAKAINGNWDSKTITYDDVYPLDGSEPIITYDNKISDYITGYPSTESTNLNISYFNITDIFKEWLYGERENNGFAIVPENDSVEGALFLTGEYTNNSSSTQFNTYCLVNYVDTSGSNDSFEYLSQEIGRAGSANVNTFSRSLSVNRSDLGLDGLRMPVNIDFIYTPAIDSYYKYLEKEASIIAGQEVTLPQVYGNHWYSSYCFYPLFAVEGQVQIFTNEGTVATFNLVEETVTETSQEITRTVKRLEADETSDSGYELELIDPNSFVMESNIKLILPSGEQVYFNDDGSTSIREEEPNSDGSYDEIRIVYLNRESLMIDYITDGIGRKYDFVYDSETGLLTEIKCLTAEGTPIKAGTTDTDLKVTYGYDSNGNLTSVTYPDGEIVTYSYDSIGNLVKAQNIDGYNIQYTYDNSGKVTHIAEYVGTTAGNTIDLVQLSSRQVKVVDGFNGTETYQFGRDGRLNYTFDEKGNYLKSDYAPANDENVFSSNDWSISSQNLLKNGSFETASALRATRGKYWSTEFETTDLPEQQIDNKKVIGYDSKSFGEKAYLISSASPCTEFLSQTVEISTPGSYTLSAFVRSETAGKLTLKIKATDGSGNVQYSDKVEINSTVGWERYSVTYTPKNNFEPESITVSIGFEENKGTYYVDCVQLEKGLGTAEYNLIENGTFNNADEYWSDSTIATDLLNGEPIKAVKLSGGLPQYTVTEDGEDEELILEDNISATTQNVKINGKKGETYSIGGWFKGWFDDNYIYDKVDARFADLEEQLTNSTAQLKVTYSYTDTVTTTDEATNETTTTEQAFTENFVVDFAPHNEDWQYATDSFALKGDTESVDVTIIAKNIPADSYATGIELALDNNAFSFFETDDVTEEAPEEPGTDEEDNSNTQNTGTGNTTPPEECPCEACEEFDCSCRCDSADICACVQCSRRSDIETTSEDGKTITTSSFDGEKYMQSAITYSDDLNNIISETDENNISSGYAYNVNGGLTSFTDGAGNSTTYQSNAMGYLTLAESNVSGLTDNAVKMAISYVYDGDLLTNVTEGNVQYTYEYDGWGQLCKILVDGETLICYNYGENEYRTRILSVVFGSSENTGFTVLYGYDENGNIDSVEKYRKVDGERDSITYNYKYDNLGNLDYIIDNGTGHFLDYTDDGIVIKDGQNGPVIYETKDVTPEPEEDETSDGETEDTNDETPEIVSITQETANGTSYNHKIYESGYNKDTGKSTEKEAVSVVLSQDENNSFTYGKTIGTQTLSDWFGRNEAVTVMTKDPVDTATDFASISSQYGYVTNENVTTNLISSVTNTISGDETNTVNYNYIYDSNGRIINTSSASSVDELVGASQYVYDEAGQLIREITGSKTYEYAYDSKGNISTRKLYSNGTLTKTDTFTYGADTWEDRLTGYNNQSITYDSIGNPTSYRGATLSWRGRELAGYSKGNKQISYSYDVDGMRYRKTVKENDSVKAVYDYVYSDGTLILLTYTANGVPNTARFVYDSWGEPRGFMLNDSATYLYLKNAQGDITGIVDENGAVLLTYTYTAWGEVSFTATDMQNLILAGTLSNVNPFTYRGYCYDYDIGMYYLQSRYYDPTICRFINADSTDYLGATGTLLSYNLFAYCENDGVNAVDETGTWGKDVHLGYYTKDQKGKKNDKYSVTTDYVIGTNGMYIPFYAETKRKKSVKVYYGTYYWAIDCGINAKNAKIIAFHCNDVDNQFSPLLSNYQSWHFDTNYTVNGSTDSRLVISFFMCIEASFYFDEALNYKKGSKKYKSAVKKGLMYLGYALHPIQDIYAHTPDRCYRCPVPYIYYFEDLNGQMQVGSYLVSGWSHFRARDTTDKVKARLKQVENTRKHTVKILETFMECYGTILDKDNGVKL